MINKPPENLPIYRLISGQDDAKFCERVSEQIVLGYELYGSPSISIHNGKTVVCQALIWPFSKINM